MMDVVGGCIIKECIYLYDKFSIFLDDCQTQLSKKIGRKIGKANQRLNFFR
jgi:hypothetical protein